MKTSIKSISVETGEIDNGLSAVPKLEPRKKLRSLLARNWAGTLVSGAVVVSLFYIIYILSVGVTRAVVFISHNVSSLLV